MRSQARIALAALLALSALAPAANAAWPNSSFTNLPVCTAPIGRSNAVAVSDDARGAIIAWQDLRGGTTYDIYAQHVLASGAVDPAWPANGRALCTATNDQKFPTIVSDGAGGAIVTWQDYRGGTTSDIYAQHVLASGVADPAWPVDGRGVCTAANYQQVPTLVSDGAGGVIITWYDFRGAISNDIYAQHVLASGAVDPAWPANGRALCTQPSEQTFPVLVSDGAGGAIVAWRDQRGFVSNADIYAQHVMASGAVDPAWIPDGNAICTHITNQSAPSIVSDGSGGAIIAWYDNRLTTNGIFGQHVLASGVLDPTWNGAGSTLTNYLSEQVAQTLVSDGAGGAIIAWQDFRSGSPLVFAQHVLASGAVDPLWPANDVLCSFSLGGQYSPSIVADGVGGAIIDWYDLRAGTNYDIYAQHVLASGSVDATYASGLPISTATNNQVLPVAVTDGTGGAIVTWLDSRSGVTGVYAQRVARFGKLGTPEAEIVGAKDVPNDQGGKVKLSWSASYLDLGFDTSVDGYDVLRSVSPTVAASLKRSGTTVRALSAAGPAPHAGDIVSQSAAGVTYYWEYIAAVAALHYVSGYSYIAPTLSDSIAASNPPTAFMVVARNGFGGVFWPSQPALGYSVDNLPPAVPAPFAGQYTLGTTHLHWNRNTEADLAGYRLYRGSSPSFTRGPGSLVASLPDTGYADPAGAVFYYQLTAIDAHGNESPAAFLSLPGTTGVEGVEPVALAFAAPSPNPASHAALLAFTLPRAGSVRLAILDAAGRRVRVLADGVQDAGPHALTWDLRNEAGRAVAAGLYFARLETSVGARTQRLAVTR